MPPITYVGSWQNGIIGFNGGTFRDAHTVTFEAFGGDAGESAKEIWELDLNTGSTTRMSRTDSSIYR